MKFDIQTARQIDEIVVWASQQKGRISQLAQRVNMMLAHPVAPTSAKNWLRPNRTTRSEPSVSSGLALFEAFRILRRQKNGITPKGNRAAAGSARRTRRAPAPLPRDL
jgi:hypothetical protein